MSRAIILAVYVALVIAALIVEWRAQRRPAIIAPLGEMLEHVMSSRITRVGVTAAWWWFGWHFLFAETVQLEL